MASRSMSVDELEAVQEKARKLTILDLKKRALAAKQGGDLGTAMGCLKQAKKIEAEDFESEDNDEDPPYSSTLPLFWKKVALLCKQAGDIDRAKQALVHSKELEAAIPETGPDDSEAKASISAPAPSITSTETLNHRSKPEANEAPTAEGGNEDLPPPLYDDLNNFPPPPPPSYDNLLHNCQVEGVANEEEADMLAELMGGGSVRQEKSGTNACHSASSVSASTTSTRIANSTVAKEYSAYKTDANLDADVHAASTISSNDIGLISSDTNITDTTPSMTFTDEELMDEEMMMEFASGGVKGIPNQERFAAKVLGYKKLALKFKQEGNIPKATQHLRAAKQLEKVALALQATGERPMDFAEENPLGWLETLDPEESELLGELLVPPQSGESTDLTSGAAATASTTDRLTLEDLEEMDDDNDVMELVEMMGPNALPTVEEVTAKITKEKQNALKYKQDGNIELAKSSLLKSKMTKLLAMRLAEIYRKLEFKKDKAGDDDDGDCDSDGIGDTTPISMEDLEALMGGDSKPREAATTATATLAKKPSPPQPPKDPWLLKPSIEIKAEVIRLKNEKQVGEATRLLKLFKQKLAQEQAVAEREQVAKMISTIRKQLEVCTTQRRLWQYYHWFGKEITVGAGQYQEWTTFGKDCQKAILLLKTEGSASVKLAPRVSTGVGTAKSNNPNSNGNPPAKKLFLLEDDITSLVESCTNDTTHAAAVAAATGKTGDDTPTMTSTPNFLEENALEVAILGLFEMEQNEKLQKIFAKKPKSQKAISEECPDVRIHAKLQLPIQPEDPSKPSLFNLEPSTLSLSKKPLPAVTTGSGGGGSKAEFRYDFEPSSKSCRKQVSLPRKDPKHERTLLRRMETKTLQLSVFYLHNQNKRKEAEAAAAAAEASPKRTSWFFGGRGEVKPPESDVTGEGESKDIFLGKVTIEFKPLLSRGCLAGDFPILVNSRAIGGTLRVCLRSRPVLDPDRYEGLPWVPSDGAPVSLTIATYKQGLSFAFPNERNSKESYSIESIKRESESLSPSNQGTS